MDVLQLLATQIGLANPEEIGYLAVFAVLFLDGASVPFTPVELFLGLTGYLVATGDLDFATAYAVTIIGCMTGHLVSYFVGYRIGSPFFRKYGKYLLITHEHLDHVEERIKHFGPMSAFLFRFIPGLRSLTSLLLGVTRRPFVPFVFLTLLAVMLWNLLFLIIGMYFGLAFARYSVWIVPFSIGVIVTGLFIAGFVWVIQWRKKR